MTRIPTQVHRYATIAKSGRSNAGTYSAPQNNTRDDIYLIPITYGRVSWRGARACEPEVADTMDVGASEVNRLL